MKLSVFAKLRVVFRLFRLVLGATIPLMKLLPFGVGLWDPSGKRYCSSPHIANGTTAISPDGHLRVGGIVDGAKSINIWNLQTALAACGVASDKKSQ